MSFLSNLSLGSSGGSTSYAPTSTSAFGNLFNNVADSQKNGIDAGDAANAALDVAASAIPFGSIVKGVLDKIGLADNLSNVFKYGLSSWGASTNPEQHQADFAQKVLPFVEQKLSSINAQNITDVLNELDFHLRSNHYMFIALRDKHSKAKSTRLANDWTQKELNNLLMKIWTESRAQLKASGATLSRKSVRYSPQIIHQRARQIYTGATFNTPRDYETYMNKTYYEYSIKYPEASKIERNPETGELEVKQANSGGLLGLAAIAFGAFKYLK
ncbi:hypothetical protein [Zunongwangia sp. HRR-M8]|uniref:hypothetical protein n=1 Tax=Zunongwangia sp. HRR-M8 TaxID=3015170 RepID=UPI0022DD30B9|nr:hypothetical protein [Zunongwangia sp. HRR-M8]WBL20759.1 hypothetical protein PBT89_08430 [Zunongwangia sp. HRR-M8]